MSEFKRENRYIVIKRSDLNKVPVAYRSSLVDPMFSLLSHLPRREFLVIESDWPEYEPTWRAIEERVTGAALAHSSPAPESAAVLPPFAEKVLVKLSRFYDCAEDFESGGVDIGRNWLDLLTQLGLLNRVQRSPALWEISQQGEDLLAAPVAQAGQVPEGWKLVPTKPTIEMVEAGYEESLGRPDRSGHTRVMEQYEAMLAAAPAQGGTDNDSRHD